ncbi:serine hydrolase domain-containing protein [Phenylobacterium sp.]|uniref:serine hydrolase domain-containing protein n=1 Tax=Phenylobacterium sp. TaxID=1871053 RepID=UPI003BAC788C
MTTRLSRRTLLASAGALAASPARASAMDDLLAYVQAQRTTGFLVIRDRKTVVETNWPPPAEAAEFRTNYAYETTPEGALLEDVASQQKSFVAVLCAIAEDKGLLDVAQPVSDYLGAGWSKALAEQERAIRVIHLLTMSSGLDTGFGYAAPAGSTFLYNTPVYAALKRVLAAAGKASLETLTADWLTRPAGMAHTAWRQRPGAFADVGNPTGLVTSPRDTARMGQLVLDGGRGADGRRIVSEAGMKAMFVRSAANPAYGRLWWLNGSAGSIRAPAIRRDGPLIPAAPADTVAALGAMDRKLYVVPSRRLLVVRMGRAAPDRDFDQQLWLRLTPALG